MYLNTKLEEFDGSIKVAFIGCGKFISMFLSQYNQLKKIKIDTIIDLKIDQAKKNCLKRGFIKAKHDLTTTSYPLWTIDNDLIKQLVDRAGGRKGGIVSPQGPAGSMIIFHSCLVHASSNNLSPFNRISVYLSLCAVSNHIRRFKRKEYIAHRDFTPIECLPDDCLTKYYKVNLPWEKGVPESAYQTSLEEKYK